MYQQTIQTYLSQFGFRGLLPKVVLFDMDGVLFNSMPIHAQSWSGVCTEYGLDMSPEEAYMHEGRTGEATINILTKKYWNRKATPQEIQDIYAAKCRSFNEFPEAERMPGAEQVLQKVKESGLEIYVVTGSGQQSLLQRLQTNFPDYFSPERLISSKDVKHGKPHPEPYLMALERAGVQPWEALVVENAPLGVEAAVAAKVFTVAVNTGPLADEILLEKGAHLLFDSMNTFANAWDAFKASWDVCFNKKR